MLSQKMTVAFAEVCKFLLGSIQMIFAGIYSEKVITGKSEFEIASGT
jgi:hypothetical protein